VIVVDYTYLGTPENLADDFVRVLRQVTGASSIR
jgi:hypothetical protein